MKLFLIFIFLFFTSCSECKKIASIFINIASEGSSPPPVVKNYLKSKYGDKIEKGKKEITRLSDTTRLQEMLPDSVKLLK